MKLKLAITGPRSLLPGTETHVTVFLDHLATWAKNGYSFEIICGGAAGVDTIAAEYARKLGMEVQIVKPDYLSYAGYIAPLVRNAEIAHRSDDVHAFWHGKPYGGTLSTMWMAKQLGRNVGWNLIDQNVSSEEAIAAWEQVLSDPPSHWVNAFVLWRGKKK